MISVNNRFKTLSSVSGDRKSFLRLLKMYASFFIQIRIGTFGRKNLKSQSSQSIDLIINEKEYPVKMRTQDIPLLFEILGDKVYLPSRKPASGGHIVDLGANIGFTTLLFHSYYDDNKIISVEPSSGNYDLLNNNSQHLDRQTSIKLAITTSDGPIQLSDSGLGYNSKIANSKEGTYEVEGQTMTSLIEQNNIEKISLLKCDIEGGEEAIFHQDASWLSIVDQVVIEIHDKNFSPRLQQILNHYGLSLVKQTEYMFWFAHSI